MWEMQGKRVSMWGYVIDLITSWYQAQPVAQSFRSVKTDFSSRQSVRRGRATLSQWWKACPTGHPFLCLSGWHVAGFPEWPCIVSLSSASKKLQGWKQELQEIGISLGTVGGTHVKWVALTELVTTVVSGTRSKGQRPWEQTWLSGTGPHTAHHWEQEARKIFCQ